MKYQERVDKWVIECFGWIIRNDKSERNYRFLEEALELVQSLGCSKSEVISLVDYVYNREIGDPLQEVGGVMVTLAALCNTNIIDMEAEAETELERIDHPTIKEKIRNKQASKPKNSPLPQ
jgi:NTP pyrophosphatase (non-canonical NTP hydrolase)